MSFTAGAILGLAGALSSAIGGKKKSRIEESRERVADAAARASVDSQLAPEPETLHVQPAFEFLEEVASHRQFELGEFGRDENWVTCGFVYQGRFFFCLASLKNNELLMQYRNVADCQYTPENYEKVRTLCNKLTTTQSYTKVVYTYDTESNNLQLHIFVETIGPSEPALMHYIQLCFQTANEVQRLLSSAETNTEEVIMDAKRDAQMLIDAELIHEYNEHAKKHSHRASPEHGTIGEYLAYLFNGEQVEDLLSLTIQNANGTREITQRDLIAKYDILSAIIEGTGNDAAFMGESSPAVLTVDAATNHYVFTLHPLSGDRDVLSVRMTAVCTPHEFLQNYVPNATYVPRAISMRLCYVKTDLPDTDAEADQELPHTDMGAQVKHGHKLLQQQCYLQAIAVLTPIFQQLKSRFFNLNEREKNMFYQVCFYLGFCYSDLRIFDKGFYYLDMVKDCNRFDYSQEYINCITNSGDPFIFAVLNNEAQEIVKQLEELEKDDDRGTERMMAHHDRLVDYYAFLQRRRGYAQIAFGYLDDAEETFKQLLEHDGSRSYAENELRYIEKLRKKTA